MSSFLMRYSVLYELNTLDACWIPVDVWSNSSRHRIVSIYLSRTWCLYTWSCLDILITMLNSINLSTVICSSTVILMLSWEKPLVKPMAPGSISYHICFQSTFICIFTFPIYIIKYQKYIYLIILSLSDLTFASGREGIDNPFIALVASSSFVCVGAWDFWGASYWIDTLVLKNWGKYLRYFTASPFLFKGKSTQCSRGSSVVSFLKAPLGRLHPLMVDGSFDL